MTSTSGHSYVSNLFAPFGSWLADRVAPPNDEPRYLAYGSAGHTFAFSQEKYVGKIFHDLNSLARELKVMERADDCVVDVIGRLYATDNQKVRGIVMPCETVIDPPSLSKDERKRLVLELRDLALRFHRKGLVHGDIKPANLLRCSPGSQLRFCDFETSSLLGDGFVTPLYSTAYSTTRRVQEDVPSARTLADDYHALGMSMWEIYVGTNDFWVEDVYADLEEDATKVGWRPDLSRVDDPDVARLIGQYLDMGSTLTDVTDNNDEDVFTRCVCVEKTYALRDFRADPPHLATTKHMCLMCKKASRDLCPYLHRDPSIHKTDPSMSLCTICEEKVRVFSTGDEAPETWHYDRIYRIATKANPIAAVSNERKQTIRCKGWVHDLGGPERMQFHCQAPDIQGWVRVSPT
ncbi:hypothetical protein BT96DRAFT_912143 [Gymnopus androsaceus JB14]|uniref:Protein kinase domain-containing protein n=1 Tax=Gymnopus androsaceus JB14 TaxID=1447944 RepID=A0A6A4IMG8_9AGAR|nr:hypothetical protein BT96DRAFT_912143 [Gymnopus androsaceus JB14]